MSDIIFGMLVWGLLISAIYGVALFLHKAVGL